MQNSDRENFLNYVFERNQSQKKKITNFLKEQNVLKQLDEFFAEYSTYFKQKKISIEDIGEAYLKLVDDMCYARLEFVRSGKYPRAQQTDAVNEVYNNFDLMTKYMLGLAISQFLWRQHFALFNFYKDHIGKFNFKFDDRLMEVGSGHGLFLSEILKVLNVESIIDVVDISESSIIFSRDLVKILFSKNLQKVNFIQSDIMNFHPNYKYKLITMGEVLEHVEQPNKILESLHALLSDDGMAYISTCTNCPAIDHVFHFKNILEIQQLIIDSGFKIVKEIVEPSECCSQEKIEKYKLDVLYGAFICKA